jgi:hypothetical protein
MPRPDVDAARFEDGINIGGGAGFLEAHVINRAGGPEKP